MSRVKLKVGTQVHMVVADVRSAFAGRWLTLTALTPGQPHPPSFDVNTRRVEDAGLDAGMLIGQHLIITIGHNNIVREVRVASPQEIAQHAEHYAQP